MSSVFYSYSYIYSMNKKSRRERETKENRGYYELHFREKGEPRDIGYIVLLYTFKIHLYISFISPTYNTQP